MKHKAVIIKYLKKYAVIILGCIIYSLGVALFLDVNELASGGATGIAIVLNYLTDFSTGWIILIMNIPLLILGLIFFGKDFAVSTIFATVLSSLLIELWSIVFAPVLPLTENILIASVVGGGLFGAGLGFIFRMGSSTGGTDIIVKLLRKKFRSVRTGLISFGIDTLIVIFSAFVYRDFDLICYTIISIIAFTIAFDAVLYGGNSAKLVFIITDEDKIDAIKQKILNELDISATLVDGQGAYSGQNKCVIMCAIKNILYPKLHDVVRDVDPNAFTIVSSAKEIYGEGYKNHNDQEL